MRAERWYLIEHSVASTLPPLSPRRPLHSGRLLLSQRRWLFGFGVEAMGWLLYVLALALAPLSLVQATAAGGVGILAVMVSRYRRVPLTPLERGGVALSVGGLVLLGISLAGAHGEGSNGSYVAVGVWLGASVLGALAAARLLPRLIGGGPAYGIATGVLFAAGDVSTKAVVGGGDRVAFVAGLVGCYALGTMVLQAGFQRGNPLTTAGIATLFTNALPIVAGGDDLRGAATIGVARRRPRRLLRPRDSRCRSALAAPARRCWCGACRGRRRHGCVSRGEARPPTRLSSAAPCPSRTGFRRRMRSRWRVDGWLCR